MTIAVIILSIAVVALLIYMMRLRRQAYLDGCHNTQKLIDYVDFATCASGLLLEYYKLQEAATRIENSIKDSENKADLRNTLSNLYEVIKQLKRISNAYGRSIVEGSENLSDSLLEEELGHSLNKRAENSGNVYNG